MHTQHATAAPTAAPPPDTAPRPSPPRKQQPARGLDARLAATDTVMRHRLAEAGARHSVDARNAEHTVDLDDVVRGPITLPEPPEAPYPTPAAAALQRAARRLHTDGWCRGATRSRDGALCLYGAIETETRGDSRAERDALSTLLDTAHRHLGQLAETIPAINDLHLRDEHAAVRLLDEAARLADTRGL